MLLTFNGQHFYFVFPGLFHGYSRAMNIYTRALVSSRAFTIPSYNNKKFSSSELLPGDSFPLTDILAFLITDCIHVNAYHGITLGPKNNGTQAQRVLLFIARE